MGQLSLRSRYVGLHAPANGPRSLANLFSSQDRPAHDPGEKILETTHHTGPLTLGFTQSSSRNTELSHSRNNRHDQFSPSGTTMGSQYQHLVFIPRDHLYRQTSRSRTLFIILFSLILFFVSGVLLLISYITQINTDYMPAHESPVLDPVIPYPSVAQDPTEPGISFDSSSKPADNHPDVRQENQTETPSN